MSFTHMGAGLASPDSSSSQLYRRGVLIHCPPEYSVDIVPPIKEGSSWHYGLRVKPLANLSSSPLGNPAVDAKGRRIRGYEIHRKWEDCLDLQRVLEKEYAAASKARKSNAGKKGPSLYTHPQRAASFDSLPTGPDPKSIPTDIHAFLPKLAAKSSLFRGASGSALVQQRSEEFNEFISALFAPGVPILIDQVRQVPAVREWFGFWRRDRDAMRRRDADRASLAPSVHRLSIAPSDVPPLPTGQPEPVYQPNERQSHETTFGDLASALDTFPMPPTPEDSPLVAVEPKVVQPSSGGFVPIVQRRLGSIMRPDTGNRNTSFRNAQFFDEPVTAEPEIEDEEGRFETVRGARVDDEQRLSVRSPRAPTPSMSSASTHLTAVSMSARSSQTSSWSMGLSSSIVQAIAAAAEQAEEPPLPKQVVDEESEIAYARKMSLSSLSSNSSRRAPPPIPPRSSLRRSASSGGPHNRARSQSDATKPMPVPSSEIPTVVYDEQEPEFEIVTHSVLHSYLDDGRSSYSGFGSGASSVRRSMTPSIGSAYSTSESISSAISQPPAQLSLPPVKPLRLSGSATLPPPSPAPMTPLPTPVPGEIVLKAICTVGESIVLCRIPRNTSLESVRSLLATKFVQAAGVELDLLAHGFVLGYVSQLPVRRPGARPGTAGSLSPPSAMPVSAGRANSARPGTAPSTGRARSSSVSSVTASADPTHLTLIVTQRDWESAVAKHGEKMTVRVLLA
ncbi:hypothetical protein RhiJN_02855 [Ceratobasidium sp. AG-Ba]|nr:hypothetical protein RhiJN_02855 [Ceratobasidium sp. AG-Ba]